MVFVLLFQLLDILIRYYDLRDIIHANTLISNYWWILIYYLPLQKYRRHFRPEIIKYAKKMLKSITNTPNHPARARANFKKGQQKLNL